MNDLVILDKGELLAQHFRAIAILSPFRMQYEERAFPVGTSVRQAMRAFGLPARVKCYVAVNGIRIDSSHYEDCQPSSNSLLTIRVILANQGTSAQFAQMALQIAGTAVGFALGGPAGAAIGGMLGSLAGGLLGLILAPHVPKPKLQAFPPTYTISGNKSGLSPFSPIPTLLGKRKNTPTYYGSPFSETFHFKQYLRMLVSCGNGPIDISEIKIKGTSITHYTDVQWEMRAGYPDDVPLTLYTNIAHEDDFSILLYDSTFGNLVGTGWQERTTVFNVTTIAVDVAFPQGLETVNNVGNVRWAQVNISIRYALTGTDHGTGDDNWTLRPVLKTRAGTLTEILNTDSWTVPAGQYDVQVEFKHVLVSPGGGTAYPINILTATCNWTALRTFRPGKPVAIANQCLLDLRILATGQLNGVIDDLTLVGQSITPDFVIRDRAYPISTRLIDSSVVNSTVDGWSTRAGSWVYDYEVAGKGCARYNVVPAWFANPPPPTDAQCLTIVFDKNVSSGDGAYVASKYVPVRGKFPKTRIRPAFSGEVYNFRCMVIARARENGVLQGSAQGGMFGGGLVAGGGGGLTIKILWFTDVDDHGDPHDVLKASEARSHTTVCLNNSLGGPDYGVFTLNNIHVPGSVLLGTAQPSPYRWARIEIGYVLTDPVALAWVRSPLTNRTIEINITDVEFNMQHDNGMDNVNVIPNAYMRTVGTANSNPASHFRYVLQKDRFVGSTLPDNRIDIAGLETWHELCVEKAYNHDAIFDQRAGKAEVLDQIAMTGRANKRITDGTFGIVIEQPGKVPMQMMTSRDISKYGWEAPFADRPHALRVRFANALLDYAQDEVIAYDDGFSPSGQQVIPNIVLATGDGVASSFVSQVPAFPILPGSLVITPATGGAFSATDNGVGTFSGTGTFHSGTIDYETGDVTINLVSPLGDGIDILANLTGYVGTSPARLFETLDLADSTTGYKQAWKQGRFHLATNRLRTVIHSWNTDLQHVICQRGDVLYLQHFTPRFGSGAARVVQVFVDSVTGEASGVKVDDKFLLKGNVQHAVMFRITPEAVTEGAIANVIIELQQTSVDTLTDILTFASLVSFATGNPPSAGDLMVFGTPVPLLITDIEAGQDYNEAEIKAVFDDQKVYDAERRAFIFNSTLGAPATLPAPSVKATVSSESVAPISSAGSITPLVAVSLTPTPVPSFSPDSIVRVRHVENLQNPLDGTHQGYWDPTITYIIGDYVDFDTDESGVRAVWMSLVNSNLNIQPDSDDTKWENVGTDAEPDETEHLPVTPHLKLHKNVEPGKLIDISIRYENPASGEFGPWTDVLGHQIQGQVGIPGAVSALTATLVGSAVTLDWTPPQGGASPPVRPYGTNIKWYEIREGSAWNTATFRAKIESTHHILLQPATGSHTYWVAAIDTQLNYGTPTSVVISLTPVRSIGPGGTYNIVAGDQLLKVTAPETVNLPVATGSNRQITMKYAGGSGNISVAPNGTDTIDGVNATYTFSSGQRTFMDSGAGEWTIIAS